MKFKSIFLAIAALSLSVVACNDSKSKDTKINNSNPTEEKKIEKEVAYQPKSNIRFICQPGYDPAEGKNIPTTYASTPRGKIVIVRWAFPRYQSKEWNEQNRCEAVSSRFQEAYDNGSMAYFTYTEQNNQNVICTAYKEGGDCVTMLLTLRTEDDPIAMIRDLTNVMSGKGGSVVRHSSGEKRVYFKITNIEKFLEIAPVDKE